MTIIMLANLKRRSWGSLRLLLARQVHRLPSIVSGSTDIPLLTQPIGDVFDQTTKLYGNNLAVSSCDQLHPDLVDDVAARATFAPNGGGQQWRKFLDQITAGPALHARLTYTQMNAYVNRLANGLQQLGLRKGDFLGVWLPNTWQYAVSQIAAAKLGVVLVTVNPAFRTIEAEYAFKKVELKALIITPAIKTSNYIEILNELLPELKTHNPENRLHSRRVPSLEYVINIADEFSPGMLRFQDLIKTMPSTFRSNVPLDCNDAINVQFTSGTTGHPKAALLSHLNILNNGYFVGRGIQLDGTDRVCTPVPLFHCFGLVMSNLACFTHGSAVVYPSAAFDPAASLAAVQAENCTALYGVPTMFIAELNHPEFKTFNIKSLKKGIMAGSICPTETMKQVIEIMHCRGMTICYGQTETSPVSFQTLVDDPLDARVNTVGKIHPHLTCKIIDEQGEIVPRGTKGELCTKGYSVMQGYLGDPQKTADAIDEDGWLHSGDLAVFENDGYCRIVGRIKDLIIRGGENIGPREIEDVLFQHPHVLNVSVIGVPDDRLGEAVSAWIITKGVQLPPLKEIVAVDMVEPGEGPFAEMARSLHQHCRANMAHYKVPRYYIFANEFVLTPNGKIQKFIMRERSIPLLNLPVPKQ